MPGDLPARIQTPRRPQVEVSSQASGLPRPDAFRPTARTIRDRRQVRVSKSLAKHLRHALHELGLSLQPGGWVPVDDLLDAARRHGVPIGYDELAECVETNDTQRFAFDVHEMQH